MPMPKSGAGGGSRLLWSVPPGGGGGGERTGAGRPGDQSSAGRNFSLARLVGDEDAAEDRAGELVGQAVHVDHVPVAPIHPGALATPAELAEAGLLVGAPPGEVVLVGGEQDAVQPEGGEGVVEHQPRRLGAVAPAARVRL